ncbi:MAG: hypothetical protein EBS70_04210, partial [Actinobacteria bacterium]|nr:hypothetical protein [Actinomycetota bacterium]
MATAVPDGESALASWWISTIYPRQGLANFDYRWRLSNFHSNFFNNIFILRSNNDFLHYKNLAPPQEICRAYQDQETKNENWFRQKLMLELSHKVCLCFQSFDNEFS